MSYFNRGSVGGITTSNNWMYNNPDLEDCLESSEFNVPYEDEVEDD